MQKSIVNNTSINPSQKSERLEFMDMIRGFAFFGVLLCNIPGILGVQDVNLEAYSAFDNVFQFIQQFFLQTKFYTLFSFMFGWGAAIQWKRSKIKGQPFFPYFSRRMLALLIFGLIHRYFIWSGDILTDYALMGLGLLVIIIITEWLEKLISTKTKLSDKTSKNILNYFLLLLAIIFFIQGLLVHIDLYPFKETLYSISADFFSKYNIWQHGTPDLLQESYFQMVGERLKTLPQLIPSFFYTSRATFHLFILGFLAGRINFYSNYRENFRKYRIIFWIGLLIGIPMNYIFAMSRLHPSMSILGMSRREMFYIGTRFGALAFSQMYISIFILLNFRKAGYGKAAQKIIDNKKHARNFLFVLIGFLLINIYLRYKNIISFSVYDWKNDVYQILIGILIAGIVYYLLTFSASNKTKWQNRIAYLAPMGKMAFTVYLTHSIVFTLLSAHYGLSWYGELGPAAVFFIGIAYYLFLIVFCSFWLSRFRFGPFEWLWRCITYGKIQPIKIDQGSEKRQLNWFEKNLFPILNKIPAKYPILILSIIAIGISIGFYKWNQNLEERKVTIPFDVYNETKPIEELITSTEDSNSSSQITSIYSVAEGFTFTQRKELTNKISIDNIENNINKWTSIEYMGRKPGTQGSEEFINQLISELQAIGINPIENESFINEFEFIYPQSLESSFFELTFSDGSKKEYELSKDYSYLSGSYSDEGIASSEIIYLNYCHHDDFDNIDVLGKIILCKYEDPTNSARYALEHGAAALLLVSINDPKPENGIVFQSDWVPIGLPVVQVFNQLAIDILDLTGLKPIDLDLYHEPQTLNVSANLSFKFKNENINCQTNCIGKNIYALIPGRGGFENNTTHIIAVSTNGINESNQSITHTLTNVAFILEMLRVWEESGYIPNQNVFIAFTDANFGPGQNYGLYELSNQKYITKDKIESFLFIDGMGKDTTDLCSDGTRYNSSLIRASENNEWNYKTCNSILNERIYAQDYPANLIAFIDSETSYLSSNFKNDTIDKISINSIEIQSKVLFETIIENIELRLEIQTIVDNLANAAINQNYDEYSKYIDIENQFMNDWYNASIINNQENIIRALDITVQKVELIDDFLVADLHLSRQISKDEFSVSKEVKESDSRIKFILENDKWKWQGPYLPYQFISDDGSLIINSYSDISWDLDRVADSFNNYIRDIEFDYGLESYETYMINITAGDDTEVSNPTLLDYGPLFDERSIIAHNNQIQVTGIKSEYELSYFRSVNSYDWVLSDKRLLQYISYIIFENTFLANDLQPNIQIELQSAYNVEYPWYRNIIEQFNTAIYINKDLSRIPDEYNPIGTFAYLKSIVGWDGIQRMIKEYSSTCFSNNACSDEGWDQFVKSEIGLKDNLQFVWKDLWQDRIKNNESDLADIFYKRERALKNHDLDAYLLTINAENKTFLNENIIWYESLNNYDYYDISYDYQIIDYVANGMLVETNTIIRYNSDDGERDQRTDKEYFYFRFTQDNKLIADTLAYYHLDSEHFIVQYQTGLYQEAKDAIEYAESIYDQLTTLVNFIPENKQTIRLYNDEKAILEFMPYDFGSEAYLYTEKDQSIRIFAPEEDDFDFKHSMILQGISENLLAEMGIKNQWLRKGSSIYYSNKIDGGVTERLINSILFRVFSDYNRDRLQDIATYQDPIYQDDKYLQKSLRFEAFDTIQFFIQNYGENSLEQLLQAYLDEISISEFFENELAISLNEFDQNWQNRLILGNGSEQTLSIATNFDVENVLDIIDYLSSEDKHGRQSGSEENKEIAEYIADEFSKLGLQALNGNYGYYQPFEIQYFEQVEIPTLSITDLFTQNLIGDLDYRDDFNYLSLNKNVLNNIEGEIIYLVDRSYTSPAFEGKILVTTYREDTVDNDIKRANDYNAAALLLVTDKSKKEEIFSKMPINYYWDESKTTPVFEITAAGYNKLLKYTEITKTDLNNTSLALPTKKIVHLNTNIAEPEVKTAQNIIGYIPGSDPNRSNEVYILSAHYDFVGNDPDGLIYSGWNDNASGIATMLEIVQSWKDNNYHPAASVLVIAWDAQELGQLGSNYYVENPIIPIDNIAGMIQLDSVAYGDGYYLEAFGDWQNNAPILLGLTRGAEAMGVRLKIELNNTLAYWGLGNNTLQDSQFHGVSDQLPFKDLGINAVLIDWLGASENNLPDTLLKKPVEKNIYSVGELTSYTLMMLLGQ